MEQENKTFGAGPTLTLEPELDMSAPQNPPLMEAKPEMDPVQKKWHRQCSHGRAADVRRICREKIVWENINQILSYGAGTQKKMAEFSDVGFGKCKIPGTGRGGRPSRSGGGRAA